MATKENNTFSNQLAEIMSNLSKAVLAELAESERLFEETKAVMTSERWQAMTPDERESVKADLAALEEYVKGLTELIDKHNIKSN